MNTQAKQVLVLGLGESGLAIARWFARGGARLRLADTRAEPPGLSAAQLAFPEAEFIGADFTLDLLEGVDLIVVSPGLAPQRELAIILPAAQQRGIPVWGEMECFAQALSALKAETGYAPRVLAITGTNGKTTVTRLTGEMCRSAGLSVAVAGNISPAALHVLCDGLDTGSLPECWVLELSSFQLHFTASLNADAAVVLNLTQDHLDWHGDMASYAADKARIFGPDTLAVFNRDDARTRAMVPAAAAATSFGCDRPSVLDSLGLMTEGGMTWLVQAIAAEDIEKKKRGKPQPEVAISINRLMPAEALKIRGLHNASNVLAALALCRAIDLPLAPLLNAARDYRGEPHRVEMIASLGGVEYFDDSKGTNVGATVAALQGLGNSSGADLILIAGGDGKGQDFTPLVPAVAKYVKALVLIGRDAPQLRLALQATGIAINECASLEQAVTLAATLAETGDKVLLSPACASLDMFKSYAHRAQVFVDTVRELGLDRGEVLA
jgi:UDP-N-acetylmuramoylalanine--D-glutamate ligase